MKIIDLIKNIHKEIKGRTAVPPFFEPLFFKIRSFQSPLSIFDYLDILTFCRFIPASLASLRDKVIEEVKHALHRLSSSVLSYIRNSNADEQRPSHILPLLSVFAEKEEVYWDAVEEYRESRGELPHEYWIYKQNYDYDIYFSELYTASKRGITEDILQKYSFITLDPKKEKTTSPPPPPEIVTVSPPKDLYSVWHESLQEIAREKKITPRPSLEYSTTSDMAQDIKTAEIFLYNYNLLLSSSAAARKQKKIKKHRLSY